MVELGLVATIEKLVGLGADLNVGRSDGITPLHLALGRSNMRVPSNDTPRIKEVQSYH